MSVAPGVTTKLHSFGVFHTSSAGASILRLHKKQTRLIKPLYSQKTNQWWCISHQSQAKRFNHFWFWGMVFTSGQRQLPSIHSTHVLCGRLRGLTWKSDASKIPSEQVLEVPLSMVLPFSMQQQSESYTDWDAQLAYQLWQEYRRGRQSKIAGYCQFLTYGAFF